MSRFQSSETMSKLPPYLFTIVDRIKKEVIASGKEVIDLSMGSPDKVPCPHITDAFLESFKQEGFSAYSKRDGKIEQEFREAIAEWMEEHFDVELSPEEEVLPLIGSKEGIANLCRAVLNPGDTVLVPDIAYPVHFNGPILCGAQNYYMPLKEEHQFLPQLDEIPEDIWQKAKILFFNYPNNPTGACAPRSFYEEIVAKSLKSNLILAHDAAYSEIVFGEDVEATSVLQIEGAKDCSIEFHTLSKSFHMAGWRVGFVVGNKDIIALLEKVKSYSDFGVFRSIQRASTVALTQGAAFVRQTRKLYKNRLTKLHEGLESIGWGGTAPQAGMYLWRKIPQKYQHMNSLEFSEKLIREYGIALAPGIGFGSGGEGFVRFAAVQDQKLLDQAVEILKGLELS